MRPPIGKSGGASSAFQTLKPQYVLRGSVRRADDSTLGVDLTVATTQDGTIVPGVASRRQLGGAPADHMLQPLLEGATIELFGRMAKVPYWTCLGRSDSDPAVAREIPSTAAAAVAPAADPPTTEDYEEEAFEKITEANFEAELAALEKELE